MRDFFYFFRDICDSYAANHGKDAPEGNVTTGDASTIVECIKEKAINISNLIKAIFVN